MCGMIHEMCIVQTFKLVINGAWASIRFFQLKCVWEIQLQLLHVGVADMMDVGPAGFESDGHDWKEVELKETWPPKKCPPVVQDC